MQSERSIVVHISHDTDKSLISKYSECRPRLQSAGFRSKQLQAVAASCLLKVCSLSGAPAGNAEKLGKQIYFLAKYEKKQQQKTVPFAATVSAAVLVFLTPKLHYHGSLSRPTGTRDILGLSSCRAVELRR